MNLETLREHFVLPRNVGDLSDAEAVATSGSMICGAMLRIALDIDDNRRIRDARFKAAGCSFLVATCSLLMEQIKCMTTAEAAALAQSEPKSTAPPGQEHCAALASEALLKAIRSYSDSARAEFSGDDALICTCFGVSEQTIEQAVKVGGLRTIEDVTASCNAGGGCRSCYSLIQDILDDLR
jgi:NifU-like protein